MIYTLTTLQIVQFEEVADYFSRMEKTPKRLELTSILSELFSKADKGVPILCYLVQGKIAPDYEGKELYMADRLIVKALHDLSGKSEAEIDRILARTGDIGSVAEEILRERKQKGLFHVDLTLQDIYESLTRISDLRGQGSTNNRIKLYENMLMNATPLEAKFITRIISGKLRLGVSDSTILAALEMCFGAQDMKENVENAYNFHPDMGYIASLLMDGKLQEIENTGPEPLIPIKVMLAERLPDLPSIMEKMGDRAAMEYKYDGLRSQIHFKDGLVRIYSRSDENVTEQFPDIVESFRSTFKCSSCILDGEAVPYNPDTGELYPFQMVSQRRGRKYGIEHLRSEIPVVVFLFDIVYLDGRSYSNVPYPRRRETLENLFRENDNFKLARRIVTGDQEEAKAFFEQSIADGCEGLVIKNITDQSVYKAGARGWLWIKLKRDYQAEMADTVDLAVVGAFHGHGRRKGTYGALLMAVFNSDSQEFQTVCKLGTGFTDDILKALPSMLQPFVSKEKPPEVSSNMVPDVWFHPGLIMEVAGAEITISPVHTCSYGIHRRNSGLSIRFPRFTGRFRDDKDPFSITKASEIEEMFLNQKKSSQKDDAET